MQDAAYQLIGSEKPNPWLIGCDHASNSVPASVSGGSLGLDDGEMDRHIAYDIGAEGVTRALVENLGAAGIISRFSRLVIDPNRGEDDPTLIMKVYDQTIVPGNRTLDAAEREHRLNSFYRPYHNAFAALARGAKDTIVATVHSFTPQLNGRPKRPWHIGLLYDHRDQRLARPLLERLQSEPDLTVGENEPYAGHLPGDTIDRHALGEGRANVLIEIRHDLIASAGDQKTWADRIAPILEAARQDAGL